MFYLIAYLDASSPLTFNLKAYLDASSPLMLLAEHL